jgi:hypothetical protein
MTALQDQLALERTEAQQALAARRANNDPQLMSHTMALDRIFIEYPDLRPGNGGSPGCCVWRDVHGLCEYSGMWRVGRGSVGVLWCARRRVLLVGLAGALMVQGALGGCGAAPPAEPSSGSASSAAIRAYLADHFIYKSWYASIRRIDATQGTAIVVASLPAGAERKARAVEICAAVLSSRRVRRVVVRDTSASSVVCP